MHLQSQCETLTDRGNLSNVMTREWHEYFGYEIICLHASSCLFCFLICSRLTKSRSSSQATLVTTSVENRVSQLLFIMFPLCELLNKCHFLALKQKKQNIADITRKEEKLRNFSCYFASTTFFFSQDKWENIKTALKNLQHSEPIYFRVYTTLLLQMGMEYF